MSVESSDVASTSVLHHPRFQTRHGISKSLLRRSESLYMLREELEVKTILPILLSNNVISGEELSRLKVFRTRRRMTDELMEVLLSRSNDEWVDGFVLGLQISEQNHIIEKLTTRKTYTFRAIKKLRKTTVQQRVFLPEHTLQETVRRSYDSTRFQETQDILNCDILTIYEGSICFLLDPNSHRQIQDLFNISKTEPKLKTFLLSILGDRSSMKYFKSERKVTIEMSKIQSGFIFRLNDKPSKYFMWEAIPAKCSDCYRHTVMHHYENVVDEIESVMISATFNRNEDRVPKCIIQACLKEKTQRSRQERADIFLRFILTDELLLLRFREVFENLSEVQLKNVPCRVHSGKEEAKIINSPKKLTLCFNVCYNVKDDTLHIRSSREEFSLRARFSSYSVERPLSIVPETNPLTPKKYHFDDFAMLDDLKSNVDDCMSSVLRQLVKDTEIRLLIVGSNSAACDLLVTTILNDKGFYTHKVSEPRVGFYYDESFGKKIKVSGVPASILKDKTRNASSCIDISVAVTSPGPHAVIVTTWVSQSGQQIEEILSNLENKLGKVVRQHVILTVIGTKRKRPIVVDCNPITRELVDKGQYIQFHEDDRQMLVWSILDKISSKYWRGEEKFFTNPLFKSTEEIITGKSGLLYNERLESYRKLEREIARLKAEIAPRAIMQQKLLESDVRDVVILEMIRQVMCG